MSAVPDGERLPRTSPTRLVLASPLHRGATAALFISGVATSAAAPLIAFFLVVELGASLSTAGLFYLTNLTAPVAGYLVGARSDRTGARLGLFRLCALVGLVGWLLIAFSTALWVPFVVSAVVLGFAGAATSQLFAAVHDELAAHPDEGNDGVVAVVRMALTAGWVIGPVAGSFVAAAFDLRVMLLAVAMATAAQAAPLGTLRTPRAAHPEISSDSRSARSAGAAGTAAAALGDARGPGLREMLPLLAFIGLYVLVYAGEPIKYAYLPIYMNTSLHLAPALSGAVIGIQPLAELVLMPVAIVLARRTGAVRLMAVGAGLGVAANLCFASGGGVLALFAGQLLMGGVWGVFAVLGIIVAQRLLPTAVATASALFISASPVGSALGGLAGGLGVARWGLPAVFWLPAVFGVLAVVGLLVLARTTARHP